MSLDRADQRMWRQALTLTRQLIGHGGETVQGLLRQRLRRHERHAEIEGSVQS